MLKVQWYPGHMTKAKRKLEEQIKTIDVVIEVRDARIPRSSSNPIVKQLTKNKGHLILLNKADLANRDQTVAWLDYFKHQGIEALALKGTDKGACKKILPILEKISQQVFQKRQKRGLLDRPLRCMVVGISNVGKSSLINSLAKKKIAQTGNRPGVTKGNQWIRISPKVELLDTPGILWPKFDGDAGFNLAITGAVSDLVFDPVEAALELINRLFKEGLLDSTETVDPLTYLETYCKSRGLLNRGGIIDLEKGAFLFNKDFKDGKWGSITLERPGQPNGEN